MHYLVYHYPFIWRLVGQADSIDHRSAQVETDLLMAMNLILQLDTFESYERMAGNRRFVMFPRIDRRSEY
mgnify:CR=1 FL=1